MGFFCSNPRCSKKNKPFATFRGLQKHTTQSAMCLNFVCCAQFQQDRVKKAAQHNAHTQIVNSISENNHLLAEIFNSSDTIANHDNVMNANVDKSEISCDVSKMICSKIQKY